MILAQPDITIHEIRARHQLPVSDETVGRAVVKLGDERVVDSTPLNTPRNTTILSSIRLDGRTVHTVYLGGMTAERFAEYLKKTLLPSLSSNDSIIMDNMRSHHARAVKQVLDASGIRHLYLPPYSPDFNSIEKCG